MNTLRVTRALMWQNRWALLMFALWPLAMAAILLFPHDKPDADDVLSVLHQECFYALALVSVTASSLLGTEQKSRRAVFVLARSVSRPQYLLAALFCTLASAMVFTICFLVCGEFLVRVSGGNFASIEAMAVLQFAMCIWFACAGILFSVFLPGVLASVAVSLAGGAIFLFGQHSALFGLSRIIPDVLKIPLRLGDPSAGISGTALASILVQSALIFALTVYLFGRRDLSLKDS